MPAHGGIEGRRIVFAARHAHVRQAHFAHQPLFLLRAARKLGLGRDIRIIKKHDDSKILAQLLQHGA